MVIDEIQRYPDLYAVLRVLADNRRSQARFLVLGSASPDLFRQSSETLAGRIVYHELRGFALEEVGAKESARLWLRGRFPRSYLSLTVGESDEWRRGFIRTFLERDLPQSGINIRSVTLNRFWTMLAQYHGQVFNASEFAPSFGPSEMALRDFTWKQLNGTSENTKGEEVPIIYTHHPWNQPFRHICGCDCYHLTLS